MGTPQIRNYEVSSAAIFRFTKGDLAALTNFTPGMELMVPTEAGEVRIDSSETLYQIQKFKDHPEIQEQVLKNAWAHEKPARGGKDTAIANKASVSEDWQEGRSIQSMRYTLRMKLAQHREAVIKALDKTGNLPIVEHSSKNSFWGAKPDGPGTLRGMNVLGRLWMEIREELRKDPDFCKHTVPSPGTCLMGSRILPWIRPAQVLNAHAVGTNVSGAVYVGRPSKWGNPIQVSDENPRGAALDKYLDFLRRSPDLVSEMRRELAGKDLICWCAPRACHAEVIRHVAAGNAVPETWNRPETKNATDTAPQATFDF